VYVFVCVCVYNLQLELIQRLRNGAFPNKSSNGDMRQEQNHEVAEVAWSTNHEPKRRFVPSKWEAKLVLRVIRTLRAHATLNAPQSKNLEQKMIWDAENTFQSSTPVNTYLPAQKAKKPNHVDSYNPPFEYQVGDEGASEMNGRDHNATHATYTALRRVPSYSPFVVERFTPA